MPQVAAKFNASCHAGFKIGPTPENLLARHGLFSQNFPARA
jgi:hypothetical protein